MSIRRSVFQSPKSYKVTIPSSQEFIVEIEHSTINSDIENLVKQLNNNPVQGFQFTVVDLSNVRLSIMPFKGLFEVSNTAFRGALSMLNKHRLTSKELEEILTAYKDYLKEHNLESKFDTKHAKLGYFRTDGNAY